MIKIFYPDGRIELQNVRKLSVDELLVIFDGWAIIKHAYSVQGKHRRTEFYFISKDTENLPDEERPPLNKPVYDEYGVKVWGIAILCREDAISDDS